MVTDFSKQQLCFEHESKQIVVLLREINKRSQGVVRLIHNENVRTRLCGNGNGVGYIVWRAKLYVRWEIRKNLEKV